MSIDHVLAVVPVSDIERSRRWYEALVGRPGTTTPWRRWLSGESPRRAGSSFSMTPIEQGPLFSTSLLMIWTRKRLNWRREVWSSMRSKQPTRVFGLPGSPTPTATELPSSEVSESFTEHRGGSGAPYRRFEAQQPALLSLTIHLASDLWPTWPTWPTSPESVVNQYFALAHPSSQRARVA